MLHQTWLIQLFQNLTASLTEGGKNVIQIFPKYFTSHDFPASLIQELARIDNEWGDNYREILSHLKELERVVIQGGGTHPMNFSSGFLFLTNWRITPAIAFSCQRHL